MALNTHRQYAINNQNVAKSVEKLSSGLRVNLAFSPIWQALPRRQRIADGTAVLYDATQNGQAAKLDTAINVNAALSAKYASSALNSSKVAVLENSFADICSLRSSQYD